MVLVLWGSTRPGGRVPGLQPQKGPFPVTGGHLTLSWTARRRGAREKATGPRPPTRARKVNILQWNAEGVYNNYKDRTRRKTSWGKHWDSMPTGDTPERSQRFDIRGYQVFRQDRKNRTKGGVAILVRNSFPAQDLRVNTNNQTEIHGVTITLENQQIRIFNAYYPVDRDLSLDHMKLPDSQRLVLEDFNSHSEAWGYPEADRRGEEVEDWQVDNKLLLLNGTDDPPTFFSRRWLTSTTPDLAFATEDMFRKATRMVLSQLGGRDHEPVLIT